MQIRNHFFLNSGILTMTGIFKALTIICIWSSCTAPKAVFVVEKLSNHAPASVKFQNRSVKADAYIWDFGDGKISQELNPEHRYSLSGKYTVTLKAIKGKKQHAATMELVLDPPNHCLVEIHTSLGTMIVRLYDDTPLHRDNFIKLAESGYYDGTLFHRVIKGFMVQGGDPESKDAPAGKKLGTGGPKYKIPAEFSDTLFHIKGALAAARMGDPINPKKESSGSQFYIVQGNTVSNTQLDNMELQKGIRYSQEAREIMTTQGGAPQLDNEYTIFGRVIKGFEVIDAIAESKTDKLDRPLVDVKILSIKIIK